MRTIRLMNFHRLYSQISSQLSFSQNIHLGLDKLKQAFTKIMENQAFSQQIRSFQTKTCHKIPRRLHKYMFLVFLLIYFFYSPKNHDFRKNHTRNARSIENKKVLYNNKTFYKYQKLDQPDPRIKSLLFPDQKYLLPVIHFQEGPNNLYRLMKETALLAYKSKRALAVPVMHTHPRMQDLALNPFRLPIFETDYSAFEKLEKTEKSNK